MTLTLLQMDMPASIYKSLQEACEEAFKNAEKNGFRGDKPVVVGYVKEFLLAEFKADITSKYFVNDGVI